MMKTWYVYAHYTLDTNELFYIGIGYSRRAWSTKRNAFWHSIVNKHGYRIEMIAEDFTDRDLAVKKELEMQRLYKPRACLVYGDRQNQIVSDEFRLKMSKITKGRKMSEETKQKLRDRVFTPEWRQKISEASKGKVVSKETRQKLREANLGNKLSEETKQKISIANKGKIISKETRLKLSIAHTRKVVSEETKQKLRELNTGRKHTESARQKCREAVLGIKRSDEFKKGISERSSVPIVNCRGEVFPSATVAAKTYGSRTVISSLCKGTRKGTSGKYPDGTKIKWRYY